MYNLVNSTAWIPFQRQKSGAVEWGPPSLLTDRIDEDPIVAIAALRPDFAGAVEELLIGMLSVVFAVEDAMTWRTLWMAPPSRAVLQEKLDTISAAFNLDGPGPRFMQDVSPSDFAGTEPIPIEQILIEAPGVQTVKLNKDLFIKRDRVERMGLPAAAMALTTLQTYAPSGGQGHRTSLRGGGPLTTLIDPRVLGAGAQDAIQPLWQKLWANVSTVAEWRQLPGSRLTSLSDVFPWMAPTRTSDGSGITRATTADDAHPAQAYFGMPRRIRLDFAGPGRCDITGMECEQTVTTFHMRNYGVQYSGWEHPLSPYYRTKEAEPWLPVHGQASGLSWRDWISLALIQPDGADRKPARAVSRFVQQLAPEIHLSEVQLHAFGYDMDNMKARGWIESKRPVFATSDPQQRRLIVDTAKHLSDGTDLAARELISAGKAALFNRTEDARGDLSQYRSRVWDETESTFFASLRQLLTQSVGDEDIERITRNFLAVLTEVVLDVFDRWCPIAGLASERLSRLVQARFTLVSALSGKSKGGAALYQALGLPDPTPVKPVRAKKKRPTKGATA
jgi:CRISPR system Cascade subunit CasA